MTFIIHNDSENFFKVEDEGEAMRICYDNNSKLDPILGPLTSSWLWYKKA